MLAWLNVSYRKVGGLHFLKFGRLNFSWSVSAAYKPLPLAREVARQAEANERYMARGLERAIAVEFGL